MKRFATIDGISHEIIDGKVKCDRSLNRKAWNMTETLGYCEECFFDKKLYRDMNYSLDVILEIDPFNIPEVGNQLNLFGVKI